MALTDPPSGLHTGPGYDDTPAGNIWRQAAGPTTPGLLGRIARACYQHRRLTLVGWMAVLGCLIVLWMQFGAPTDNSFAPLTPAPG